MMELTLSPTSICSSYRLLPQVQYFFQLFFRALPMASSPHSKPSSNSPQPAPSVNSSAGSSHKSDHSNSPKHTEPTASSSELLHQVAPRPEVVLSPESQCDEEGEGEGEDETKIHLDGSSNRAIIAPDPRPHVADSDSDADADANAEANAKADADAEPCASDDEGSHGDNCGGGSANQSSDSIDEDEIFEEYENRDLESQEGRKECILEVTRNPSYSEAEKAKRKQVILSFSYRKKQKLDDRAEVERNNILSDRPQYSEVEDPNTGELLYGCEHYPRNCRLLAACCGAWVVCRFCHDNLNLSHSMDRFKTERLKCMICNLEQPINNVCINSECKTKFGEYYCKKCKFFDNTPGKKIYHCHKCEICRLGEKKDNFHCDICDACVSKKYMNEHKCLKRSLDADCPICGQYIKTSTNPVVFMRCGHTMHANCFDEYTKDKYTCPLCHKSLSDMTEFYKEVDEFVANQILPSDVRDKIVSILCHECDIKSETKFHYEYLRCNHCGGYNTSRIDAHSNVSHTINQSQVNEQQQPRPAVQLPPSSSENHTIVDISSTHVSNSNEEDVKFTDAQRDSPCGAGSSSIQPDQASPIQAQPGSSEQRDSVSPELQPQ